MIDEKMETISAKLRSWADDDYEGKYSPIAQARDYYGIENSVTWKDLSEVFRKIADDVDAEKRAIYEAQEDSQGDRTSPHHIIKAYSEHIGKPMRDRECITNWLDRWYFEKPVDENNEPVDFGQTVYDKMRGETEVNRICYTKSGFYFNESRPGCASRKPRNITYGYGERVGRPKQPVLDAEGIPIEEYDVVYPNYGTYANRKSTVIDVCGQDDVAVSINGGGFERFNGKYLTHREPDTQERIDEDAKKTALNYWKCKDRCFECPSLIDGEMPSRHYGVSTCTVAQKLDLLRRQRELDGRDA